MRKLALTTCLLLAGSGGAAISDPIERACLGSDRPGASRSLCGCIQEAANLTLSTKDQRLAASFFSNPDKAHTVWKSDTREDDTFWDRYRNFGQTAETFCRK